MKQVNSLCFRCLCVLCWFFVAHVLVAQELIPQTDAKTGKIGYTDAKGKFKIKPQFDLGGPFEQGFARVRVDGFFQYIDSKGLSVLEGKHLFIGVSAESPRLTLNGYALSHTAQLDVEGNPTGKKDWFLWELNSKTKQALPACERVQLIEETVLAKPQKALSFCVPVQGKNIALALEGKAVTTLPEKYSPDHFVFASIQRSKTGDYIGKLLNDKGYVVFDASGTTRHQGTCDWVMDLDDTRLLLKQNELISLVVAGKQDPLTYAEWKVDGKKYSCKTFAQHKVYDAQSNLIDAFAADSFRTLDAKVFLLFRNGKSLLRMPTGPNGTQTERMFDFDSAKVIGKHFLMVFKGGKCMPLPYAMPNNVPSYPFVTYKLISEKVLEIAHYDDKGKLLYQLVSKDEFGQQQPLRLPQETACSEGYCLQKDNTGAYYLDSLLKPAFGNKRFQDAQPVAFGFAAVKENGFWGIIDKEGQWVISPVVDSLFVLDKNVFFYYDNGSWGTLNPQGKELYLGEQQEYTLFGNFVLLKEKGFVGLLSKGRMLLPPVYQSINGLGKQRILRCTKQDSLTYIDTQEFRVTSPNAYKKYSEIGPFQGEFALARHQGRLCLIDFRGQMYVIARYDSLRMFTEDLAPAKINGLWGFVDRTDKTKIVFAYTYVEGFKNGFSIAKDPKGRYGIIDKAGNEVLRMQYDSIVRNQVSGFYTLLKGKVGLFSLEGKEVIFPSYDEVIQGPLGLHYVRNGDSKGVVDNRGNNVLIPDPSNKQIKLLNNFPYYVLTEPLSIEKGIIH